MNKPWYTNAIVYSLDVDTFLDSNGDGVGDFVGLTRSLDYLHNLGVDSLWLLPFYPSPLRDNGYDIMDYHNIDPNLGTLAQFRAFISKAQELNIKVIVDLVINHTSDRHEWFQQARTDKNSPFRNYYIWSGERPKNYPYKVAFEGEQEHVWSYDEQAGEYYLHRFYKEQPDLNVNNPNVKTEIKKIIDYWINLGVSGFRIDAAHILVELDHSFEKETEDFDILNFINQSTTTHGDIMLLAEANDNPEKLEEYFGDRNRMNVLFNFLLNQEIFLSLAREDATAIKRIAQKIPVRSEKGNWLNFIRHHDELTLDKLSKDEIQEVFNVFAPDKNMQIYGKGIRRRLPPILNNNRKQIELAYSLIFTLPGIPMIRYGDEIGMGDDLSLPGRESVRTAMQWNGDKNAGFSSAEPDNLIKPVISDGEYDFRKVNVAQQQHDPDSLLNWFKKLITTRKEYCEEITTGDFTFIEADEPSILIHRIAGQEKTFIAIHNLSGKEMRLKTDIDFEGASVVFSGNPSQSSFETLSPYEYNWILMPNK